MQSDFDTLKEIFEQGRLFQLSLGFEQWKPGYPSLEILEADRKNGYGYVVETNGQTAGYFALYAEGDAEYDRLAHLWRNKSSYAVVHRIVLSDKYRGKQLSSVILSQIEKMIIAKNVSAIRFDTGLMNAPMQRLLESNGYDNLGQCDFVWGPRIVYEKLL